MEADDLIHESSGQDDLIKHRDTAPHQACVPSLWVHSQVPLVTVPEMSTGQVSGQCLHSQATVPKGHVTGLTLPQQTWSLPSASKAPPTTLTEGSISHETA